MYNVNGLKESFVLVKGKKDSF